MWYCVKCFGEIQDGNVYFSQEYPDLKPWFKFVRIIFFSRCLRRCLQMMCSSILQVTDVSDTGLQFSDRCLSPFLKILEMFASLQSFGQFSSIQRTLQYGFQYQYFPTQNIQKGINKFLNCQFSNRYFSSLNNPKSTGHQSVIN